MRVAVPTIVSICCSNNKRLRKGASCRSPFSLTPIRRFLIRPLSSNLQCRVLICGSFPNSLIEYSTLFQKYVFNQFQGVIRTSAESQLKDKISPCTMGLPEIPPAPLYQRGVGGDFRDELAIQNSLANLEFLDVDPAYRLITYF